MSSDEDFDPILPKKKQWKKNKMPVCFDSDNQNDSDILEETEQSLSEQTNHNLMISDENINGFSDSDEDFDIHVRTKKNSRPLTDSENELVLDDLTTEKISKETKQITSLEISEKDWESDSSNGQSEKCPICLSKFLGQEIGNPESCDHSFCLDCLLEWAKKVNTCPVDRLPFMLILVQEKLQGNIIRRIPANNWKSVDSWLDQDDDSDLTYCEICGQCNQEDRLLLCDSCDLGYHCECLDPPLDNIPVGEWFCPNCDSSKSDECNLSEELMADFQEMLRSHFRPRSSIFHPRIIARTSAIETVRHRVQRRREAQLEEIRNSLSPHIINREKNRNFISKRNKSNRLSINFSTTDQRMRRIIAEQSPLITSVTKRRFAQRLGLQRTACGILHGSDLSYSYYLDNEQFPDEDASYDSSSSNEDSYLFDNSHGCTSYNYKQSTSNINTSPPKSSSRLRIRVPSPQVNNRNILNEILETQSLLHSNSQNITIEKDGSLKLSDCTQQRPQNPLQQSTSTDKNKTIPSSTTCTPESSHSESRINQWYGNERELVTSTNHNRNYYEDQQSGNYGSNLCVDKKKEYHHSRTKETKTQSEDEVDIYSDIESLGDEIIEDELDNTTNEQCNITNVYRCDLQHDNMEEDSDSSENELVIDEDVKVGEEDSHSVVWNEENTRCSLEEENSQNNFLLKNDMPKFETAECSNDNIENSGLSQITDIPSQIVCEEKISDSSNSRNFSPEEMIDDDDDDDGTTMNDDEVLENMEQDYTFSEDGKSNNIKTEENFSMINRTSKIEKNLRDDKNINKADAESLSSISNEQINVEDSLSSIANESIQKLHVEDNFLLSSGLEKKLSLIRSQQFDEINKVSFIEDDKLSKSLNIINTCEETHQLIENKTDESDDNISNEDEYFIEKQSLNINDIKEEDKNLDTNQTSNLSAIDYVYSTPENDHHTPVKVTIEDDENESQDSNIIYSEEGKRIDSSFKEEFYNESHFKSDRNKCIKMKENLNKKNEVTETLSKSSHFSILPAEDVEDISEAGSDDTKFKDESDDYEIDQICDNKRDDTVEHCEMNKKQLDEVEKRVAKLFESEDTSYIEENVLSNNKQNRLKGCVGEKSYSYEDEREEGEIVEEVPHVIHRIRCRKSHHRELSHQEELEDYGDHAPRINISDLPRIPKIKREKKSEIPEETNIDPKRLSVLSRVDSGNINEISWKKLSRSTRERSYRDGRPKDSRLLFREREIKQKIKNEEEKSKKDDENKRKEDKYKRLDNDKWREKTELEHLKDRRDRQKEILYEKSEKKVEKEWKIDKFDDKKESKEKFFEKSYRDEKNHRDKHKHKHRESKDYKSEKDKFQDKYAHTHIRHSHEREHTKLKDRKIKKIDIDKKDNRKEKIEKSGDKKGNKHEKKHEDESRNYYEHKKQDDLYPEITAIESKEIYAKGDSIIINVSFNRNTDQDLNIMDDINGSQKDIKKSKLKDKFPIDQRKDKLDGKHGKQKHFSTLDGMDINHTKPFKSYEKKQSGEKVQIGQMLWKETEEIRQTQEIGNKCSTVCDNSDKFERGGSPISDISGQELGKIADLHNTDILSPYNDKNIPVSPAISYESPKQRSPQFPSPPSPTENDSYDPCDPTRSPFLQKHSPSLTNNIYSIEGKPKPPPSPELPPLPLDPEPLTHLPSQDVNSLSSCLTDKRNLSDLTSVSTPVSCNSLGPSQQQQFTLPNVKIPPPNYIPQVSNLPSNTNIQSLLPNIQNWNIYSSHNNQSLMQGSFIPSHLSQGTIAQIGTLIPSSVPRLISPQHPHSSGQVMTFIPAVPNIRVPPPISSQVAVNLNQQSHMMHTFVPNKMHPSEGQLSSNIASNVKKSTSDVTEVIDMEVDSPYNSPNISKSSLQHSPKNDKFDMILTSGSKSHSQISTNEKKQQDNIKILAEKVKHSQLLSKTVITALDRMNKKIASKVEATRCNAKRSKLDSKSEIVKIRHSRSDAIKLNIPRKKELKLSEKKEIMIRMDESQLTILEDLPSSAVEMQVKEKFLKKLNRQERVVEEVKLALKPYYSRREIDKEEYKEIMRKSVPKVCHNRSGDINPVKIKILIEGYIKKFKHQQKKTGKLQKTKIS